MFYFLIQWLGWFLEARSIPSSLQQSSEMVDMIICVGHGQGYGFLAQLFGGKFHSAENMTSQMFCPQHQAFKIVSKKRKDKLRHGRGRKIHKVQSSRFIRQLRGIDQFI